MMTGFRPVSATSFVRLASSTSAPSGLCEASRMSRRPPIAHPLPAARPVGVQEAAADRLRRSSFQRARQQPGDERRGGRRSSAGSRPPGWCADNGRCRSPNSSRTECTGARPRPAAISRITSSAAAGMRPSTTGRPALMMPAFSAAICSSWSPSISQWSSPIEVITATSGCTTLVASSRPPEPHLHDAHVDLPARELQEGHGRHELEKSSDRSSASARRQVAPPRAAVR